MSGERLILRGGAQPFRVLAPGGNAVNPQFSDLLFDGDSRTLRVLTKNVVTVADTVANALYSDWTACNRTPIPLGKTFSSPPLAMFIHNFQLSGTPVYRTPYFQYSETDLSSGPSYSEFGMGTAVTVDTLYIWNGYRSISGTSHTGAYCVFDVPMGE